MDAKYLAEIKARAEAAAVHEYDGINDLIYGRDVKSLLAEVEQANEACETACASAREYCDKLVIAEKQISTLRKALELAIDRALPESSYSVKQAITRDLLEKCARQAQEQEAEK
ncbi:hypothetical protein [Caproiciproducens sp. CPB-2]|uniref:hypothetical protein n=1 Tax=Caproiciproducens sp. CPB-2 TaxID=3030017 RepID=UPI0023DB2CEA|nr:hypothetical protein [Caproiciproducens sp. CPB-2]MDF1495209.1 hypothetical protein [Caproiciproducens sp. CPB-2]